MIVALSTLAGSTRVGALQLLISRSEHCVYALMNILEAAQSRMARQVQILTQAGLMVGRRDAHWVHYRIVNELARRRVRLLEVVVERETFVEKRSA